MCRPVVCVTASVLGIVFTSVMIWLATKDNSACDTYCKTLSFLGCYGFAYLVTYACFKSECTPNRVVCDGLLHDEYGRESFRQFNDIHVRDVTYALEMPCLWPCRLIKWINFRINNSRLNNSTAEKSPHIEIIVEQKN